MIKFNHIAEIIDLNGNIIKIPIVDFKYNKYKKNKRTYNNSKRNNIFYDQQKAYNVAKRIEKELIYPQLLQNRLKLEIVTENMLLKINKFRTLSHVYRLTNKSLTSLLYLLLKGKKH